MKHPSGYWTKERCAEEALKYSSRLHFEKGSAGAYLRAMRKGWLIEITKHMKYLVNPNGFWTEQRCREEALKYHSISNFRQKNESAYRAALRLGIKDEICAHMSVSGNIIKRCIYVYEFSGKRAYVGLTYNLTNRHNRHITDLRSVVYKEINNNSNYILKQLTDYVNIEKSIKLERLYAERYVKKGWVLLNKAKTGAIGGNILKWTKDKCRVEALKYRNSHDFILKSHYAYRSALKNNWLNEICSHMIETRKPYGYWNFDNCKNEADKYQYKSELQNNSPVCYKTALEKGWLNEICLHMRKKKRIYTTYSTVSPL